MEYVIVRAGAIVAGPGEFVRMARSGERRLYVEDDVPTHNAIVDQLMQSEMVIESHRVVRKFVTKDRLLEDARVRALQLLAEIRWRIETAGIDLGGVHVNTEEKDQNRISAAYSSLKNGLVDQIDFKGVNGWSDMTLAELEPIAKAVVQHVSVCCFGAEREVSEMIGEMSIDQLRSADLEALFRAGYERRWQ